MSELTEEFNKTHFRVAIFGSARITDDDPVYTLVFNLARLIAGAGMDVVTGGGPGLMDAASKGHFKGRKDSTSHSIGLNIKLPHEQSEAAHLDIKKDFEHFSDRLDHFIKDSRGLHGVILENERPNRDSSTKVR
jgi:predicted Rossmann-fold nucleotide-binding protein